VAETTIGERATSGNELSFVVSEEFEPAVAEDSSQVLSALVAERRQAVERLEFVPVE
jgi:hypothetical protein